MDFNESIQNKKIIITGASSGIGRATAIMLSNLNAELIICGRSKDRLIETLNSLKNSERHKIYIGDLTENITIDALVESIEKIDGIVLAAGIVKTLPFKFLNQSELSNIMINNFEAPVLLCQKLLKKKKVNSNGSIVFVSSLHKILNLNKVTIHDWRCTRAIVN